MYISPFFQNSQIFGQIFHALKDQAESSLTSQQKRIIAIAGAVMIGFTAAYWIYRSLVGKNVKPEKQQELDNLQDPQKNFFNGQNGPAEITYIDGQVREGVFKDGHFIEQKVILPGAKIRAEGFKKADQWEGQGKITFPNGEIWEGIFKNGNLNGLGKKHFPDGMIVEGMFKDGKRHGRAKTSYPKEGVFEEIFKDDKLCTVEKIIYPDGETWEGTFDQNFNGKGKIILATGTVCEGVFEKGKLNGQGKIVFHTHDVWEGNFRNGKLHGQGYSISVTGTRREGEFRDGDLYEGKKISRGMIWEGKFEKGQLCDKGKVTSVDGKKFFEGEFKEGKPFNGRGKNISADGKVVEIEFINGKGQVYGGLMNQV